MNKQQRECEHHDWVYLPPGRYRCNNCSYVWYGLQPPNAADLESAKYPRSLRDEFAMAALIALGVAKDLPLGSELIGGVVFEIADKMMEARKK